MKRVIILVLIALFLPLKGRLGGLFAQIRLGYLSYENVMVQMPEYAQAQQSLADLKAKYEQEATRGEEEMQRKFTEFLQGQKEFPENILVKRQAELQSLMESGIKFRKECEALLQKAESELMANVGSRLNQAIQAVGLEGGYAAVLNTDHEQCPFVNPALGDDVTTAVKQKLGIK